jgi:hypothetical protein
VVSVGFGPSFAFDWVNVDQVRTGKSDAAFGGYFEIDVQPLCDWGLYAMPLIEKPISDQGPYYGTQFGAFFGPSGDCHKERETLFGLHSQAKE